MFWRKKQPALPNFIEAHQQWQAQSLALETTLYANLQVFKGHAALNAANLDEQSKEFTRSVFGYLTERLSYISGPNKNPAQVLKAVETLIDRAASLDQAAKSRGLDVHSEIRSVLAIVMKLLHVDGVT